MLESSTPCRIGVFLSTPIMDQQVREYMTRSSDDIRITYDLFNDARSTARQWEREGVEIFVSRRCTAAILSETVSSPVFSIPHSGLDLVTSLRGRCRPGSRVMLTNFRERMRDADLIADLLGIELIQGIFTSTEHMEEVVKNALSMDVSCVIGGWATKIYAEKYGLKFLELLPSRDHLFGALENSRNIALRNREKEALFNEYQCMLDAVSEGMLSIDWRGRLLNINSPARRLLRQDILDADGSLLDVLLGKPAATDLLTGKENRFESLRMLRGKPVIVNAYPVRTKDFVQRLVVTLREPRDIMRQETTVRSSLMRGFTAPYELRDITHAGGSMRSVLQLATACADTDSSILISGETGTGKEMLAQGIHNKSARRSCPFVSVNCAELSEQLLESELFGHEEGAFTGSRKGGKAGLFELAHTGTIFLDEINSASPGMQIKLLRVLQEKEIMPVGGSRKIPVDVKVIAATGLDLWQCVLQGLFRKDLFFRLNMLSITIPPLRERLEDIGKLFPIFISHFSEKLGTREPTVTTAQIQRLMEYSWPGNVRQLRHFAETLILRGSRLGESFEVVFRNLNRTVPGDIAPSSSLQTIQRETLSPDTGYSSDAERIRTVLTEARYNKTKAARMLGMGRTTLWRKTKKLGILM